MQAEDAQGNFFNTAFLNYTNKLKEMLENNIRAETLSIENYQLAIEKVKGLIREGNKKVGENPKKLITSSLYNK